MYIHASLLNWIFKVVTEKRSQKGLTSFKYYMLYLRRTVVAHVEVSTIANTVATAEDVRFRPD